MGKGRKKNQQSYRGPSETAKRKKLEQKEAERGLGARTIDGIKNFAGSKIRVILLVVAVAGATALALNKDGCEKKEKNKIYMVMKVNGVEFKFDIAWKDVFTDGRLDKEGVKKVLQRHLNSLSQFIDIPENLELTVIPRDSGGDVQVFFEFDIPKFKNQRVLDVQAVETDNVLGIDPGLIDKPSMLHELVHLVRVDIGAYVNHSGFEEGIAEYVERKVHPDSHDVLKETSKVVYTDYLDEFPELENVSLEDPEYLFRVALKKKRRKVKGAIQYKHEIRRRAWARFLDDPNHPARKDFIRKLQKKQKEAGKKIWELDEVLELGDSIDQGFSTWFKVEKPFQVAEERKEVRAIFANNSLHMFLFEQRKIAKEDPRDPDIFEMVPISDSLIVHVKFESGKEINTKITPKRGGLLQELPISLLLKLSKMEGEKVKEINLKFAETGERIPIKMK